MRTSRRLRWCRPAPHAAAVSALPFDRDLSVIGPMARSAADLSLLLDVIAGRTRSRPARPTAWRCAAAPARIEDFGCC